MSRVVGDITRVWIWFGVAALLGGSAVYGQNDPNKTGQLQQLQDRISNALAKAEVHREVPPVLGLLQTNPKLLANILGVKLPDILTIDEARVQEHFQGPEDRPVFEALNHWGLADWWQQEYLSLPFFVETQPLAEGKGGRIRFVTTGRIVGGNTWTSSCLQYASMLRAYYALAKELKANPSGWSHGLANLVAQDFSYGTSLAACRDLEVETAIALLLYVQENNLLSDAFVEHSLVDAQAYHAALRRAIAGVGSDNSDEALKELLRSPEEYNQAFEQEKAHIAARRAQDRESVSYVPPLDSASMKILSAILPPTDAALRRVADNAISNLRQTALRLAILNGCYDKLSSSVGRSQAGKAMNSMIFLMAVAKGEFEGTNYDPAPLVEEFNKRREQVWEQFQSELRKRQAPEGPLKELNYDPMMLKWAFRFLYNYSLPIRQKQKELQEQISAKNPDANALKLDDLFAKTVTPAMILNWWEQDPLIRQFIDAVGRPLLVIRPSRFSCTGIELDCRWNNLQRKGTKDIEEVRIYIIDPASSGGGAPQPGVDPEAKVVVRKALKDKPEVIPLKEIQPNFYVRTVDRLGSEQDMQEDWTRVVKIEKTLPSSPWKIQSGAGDPLEIGRKQEIYVRKENSTTWEPSPPLSLRANRDSLLGVAPEGPTDSGGQGKFLRAQIKETVPIDRKVELLLLWIAHGDVEAVKASGTDFWGYFANARFVLAPVLPVPQGVDGAAMIEAPAGPKRVDSLQKGSAARPGDKVNAFDYGSPHTFVDDVCDVESKNVQYIVTITYTLPSGAAGSLRVAEGQRLVVCSPGDDKARLKKAYQLDLDHSLVCGFDNGGSPIKAKITDIKGERGALGAYQLRLRQCPLVRVNGVLVPMKTQTSFVCTGVDENSLVQLSPPLDIVRGSTSDYVSLSNAPLKPARDVKMYELLLSYNFQVPPRSFWQTQIPDIKAETNNRYVKIVTGRATLICGHLQEVYVTKGDNWDSLRAVQASFVEPGQQVVWLCTAGSDAAQPTMAEAEVKIRQAAERAGSRVMQNIATSASGLERGSVHLIPVERIEEMHPTAATPSISFREFLAPDTALRQALRPNMFANGILVHVRVEPVSGIGQNLGDEGTNRGKSKAPQEPGPGQYVPSGGPVIRDRTIPTPPIKYLHEDLAQFARNREQLCSAFDAWQRQGASHGTARAEILRRFAGHYFANPPAVEALYGDARLKDYFRGYLDARDFLVSTGNWRVSPAVANGYAFLATLAYEAGGKEPGDALTRDWLCIVMRTVDKPGGTEFYGTDLYRVRAGLTVTRDLLLYVRDKCNQEAFKLVTQVEFPAESFEDVLTSHFVKQQNLHPDICSDHKVNMYNLCRQLDLLTTRLSIMPESFVAPGFRASQLFVGDDYSRCLGIQRK